MFDINILCGGLEQYKSRSFVFPIHRYNHHLRRRGINCSIYYNTLPDNVTDCNVLLVHNEVVTADNELSFGLEKLHQFQETVDTLAYFHANDGAAGIHNEVLSIVDKYYKKQLLADRTRYLEPSYSSTSISDFYHKEYGIEDSNSDYTTQIYNEKNLDKLEIAWNIGVAPKIFLPFNNRLWSIVERLPYALFEDLPWDSLFGASPIWQSPSSARSVPVSGRFGTSYKLNTVEYHRKLMVEVLGEHFDNNHLSLSRYFKELRDAKVLLSPFGYGEICHRDFEGFISGNILMKPNMGHVDTWPPIFEAGQTYIDIPWNMENANETLNDILANYEEYRQIAETGQQRYREYFVGETAADRFVDHFERVLVV